MKKKLMSFVLAAAVLSLVSCSASGSTHNDQSSEKLTETAETNTPAGTENVSTNKPEETVTQALTEPEPFEVGSMPVLSIMTSDQGSGSLDFVTKPVTRHVAVAKASWTPGYKIPPEPYYEECTVTLTDTDNSVLLDSAEAKVKVRGNWTTSYDKKPLRIKFSEKQNLLGLNNGNEYKNWVLLAEYKDYSMLRDKTALAISREILGADGLYASDAELVEVQINNEYWGVYLLAEFQQINEGRVDITDVQKDYTGTDIGYFLEFDGYYDNEEPLKGFLPDYHDNAPLVPYNGDESASRSMTCLNDGSDPYKSSVGITIKSDIYSQQQHDFIESYINNVYDIMYYAAYEDKAYAFNADYSAISESSSLTPEAAVRAVVDVDSLADTYLLNELFCDADLYWSSFFMDVDFGDSGSRMLRFEAPWDFDSALGNKDRCANGQGFYAANILTDVNDTYYTINPWLAVIINTDWFQDVIKEKWTAAYEGGTFSRAASMIEQDSDTHTEAFARNYAKWKNNTTRSEVSGELCRAALKCSTEKEAADYLESWLAVRVEFINDQWHK